MGRRKNKFNPRPNRRLSPVQLRIAKHWQGTATATDDFLFLKPGTTANAMRYPRLRKLVYGEASAAETEREINIRRLKRIAENKSGKFSSEQVLAAVIELEKTFARLERQERRERAKAAQSEAARGADKTQPGTDDPDAQMARDVAERVDLLRRRPLRDKGGGEVKAIPPVVALEESPVDLSFLEPTAEELLE
jgi:hypothetical protein